LDVSHYQRGGTSNSQHPTSNIQCARSGFAEHLQNRRRSWLRKSPAGSSWRRPNCLILISNLN
jgi:hypothetical protein